MDINTEFYGTGRETSEYGFEYTDYKVIEALNSGDLPLNEQFDMSICPWIIGEGSDIFDIRFPIIYSSTGDPTDLDSFTIGDHPIFDSTQHGYKWYFNYNPNGNIVRSLWFDGRSKEITTAEIPTSWASERMYNYIVTNFDYSKLVIAPYVVTNSGSVSIDTALSNFDPGTYDPDGTFQIYGIQPVFYYYDETNSVWTLAHFGMAALNMGKPCGSSDAAAQYTEPWFDSCVNVVSMGGLPSLGNNGTLQIYGYYGAMDNTEWISEYKVYNNLYKKSTNTPQFDNDNQVGDRKLAYFQGGDNWEQKVTQCKLPVPGVENYTYIKAFCRLKLENFDSAAAVKDYILRQLAFLGTYFIEDTIPTSSHYPLQGNADVYLPEITSGERAITTGNYAKGTAQSQYQNSEWTENPWQYTPDPGDDDYDPNTYSNSTSWHTPAVTGFSSFSKVYKLTVLDVIALHSKFFESLSGIPSGTTVTDYFEGTYLTNNPTDVIISLRYYEIDLATALPGSTLTDLYLGSYNTGMQAVETSPLISMYDLGSCVYYPHFHDFRDYEPYSYAELIVPYCGTVKISPADFMNHTISLKMSIDYSTGACTAYVFRDSLMIESISGQYGVEIPVSAIASSDLQRDIFNNANALKQARIASAQNLTGGLLSIVGGIVTQNPLAIAGGIANTIFGQEKADTAIEAAEYNLEHTKVNFKTAGAASPGLNVLQEQNARLIIYRPVMAADYDPEAYARTTGFATISNAELSAFTGFTKCATVKADGILATASEKNMIIKALQAGVYL